MDRKEFGRKIRALRQSLQLTQEKLAELSGLSPAFIGHIERGTRVPSFETVCKIADSLGCSLDELAGRCPGLPEMDSRLYEIMRMLQRLLSE